MKTLAILKLSAPENVEDETQSIEYILLAAMRHQESIYRDNLEQLVFQPLYSTSYSEIDDCLFHNVLLIVRTTNLA